MRVRRSSSAVAALAGLALLLSCRAPQPQPESRNAATPTTANPAPAVPAPTTKTVVAWRDLAIDESMGGHTLSRHVGLTDAELAERLRREPQISAASTYTDRGAAERAVGAALQAGSAKISSWERRRGSRPNLVLHYTSNEFQPLGRSLRRGQKTSRPAQRAIVVLRWHRQSDRFYVLTSYPEADR